MNTRILVLPGDGIGPEVISAAQQVLTAVLANTDKTVTWETGLIGAAAIDATGDSLPAQTLNQLQHTDAILLGAVGLPKYDHDPSAKIRPEQGLLKLRKTLGLYANVRPVTIFPELANISSLKPEIVAGVDIIFFRELISGIYFGEPRSRSADGEVAVDTMRYTKTEVQRIVHLAFQAAQSRKKQLHSIDKANVLECSRLWREVVQAEAKQFPDVTVTHMFVDNAAMQLIRNPKQFDVIVTENMFGDILTDEAAQIAGSLGLLASASVGEQISLFEPIHGSAPDIAGQGRANPIAAILSVAMLCEQVLHWTEGANQIRQAVQQTLASGLRTADIYQPNSADRLATTEEFSAAVIHHL